MQENKKLEPENAVRLRTRVLPAWGSPVDSFLFSRDILVLPAHIAIYFAHI